MNNLNLDIIEVKSQTRKLRSSWSYEIADDFKYFQHYVNFYQYEFENQKELDIIKEHFDIENVFDKNAYYNLDKRALRRIKLLMLKNDELSDILRKIIKNSKEVDSEEYFGSLLSDELAREIDKEIMRKINELKS
jgi:hypothetical protein